MEHITRFMAQTKQKFTQSNGKRPYGVSCLVIGFDKDVPKLFSTDPSGVYAEWKVNAHPPNLASPRRDTGSPGSRVAGQRDWKELKDGA